MINHRRHSTPGDVIPKIRGLAWGQTQDRHIHAELVPYACSKEATVAWQRFAAASIIGRITDLKGELLCHAGIDFLSPCF